MLEIDKVYNEDCLEGMKKIDDGSVDCVITDLPYGVLTSNEKTKWDSVIPFEPLWEQLLRVTKPNAAIVMFGQGMFTAKLMASMPSIWRYNLVWVKNRPTGFLSCKRMPMRSHEDICVFYRKQPTYNPQMRKGEPNHTRGYGKGVNRSNRCYGAYSTDKYSSEVTDEKYPISVLEFDKEHVKGMHPTQKPLDLLMYLVRTFTNPGDLVLDCCMGSGTTAVAARAEGRHFVGFETDKNYYKKIQYRLVYDYQKPLFEFEFEPGQEQGGRHG